MMPYEDDFLLGEQDNVTRAKSSDYGGCKLKLLHKKTLVQLNVMAHGDAWEGKWRGNWRMEWVASTLHTTSEHGVSSITTIITADAHT